MENIEPFNKHLKLAYIFISTVMFLPVLILPLPIIIFNNPMLVETLIPTWTLCITLLLMTVVSMDTIVHGVSSFKQAVDAMLWVGLFAMVCVSTIQNQEGTWLLASLFLIHSLRSAYHLFLKSDNEDSWWLWLAWNRDISSAIITLLWTFSLIRS